MHTDEPGTALALGTAVGTLEQVEIANMHKQTERREERLLHAVPDAPSRARSSRSSPERETARLFEQLRRDADRRGRAVDEPVRRRARRRDRPRAAPTVFVLPNNSNVILAAEQAAELSDKDVRVIRTDSIPAGLAAIVAFEAWRDADENAAAIEDAVAAVGAGAVTIASKDAQLNGLAIRKGDYLGLVDGEPVAQGDSFDDVAAAVVERCSPSRAHRDAAQGLGRARRRGAPRAARRAASRRRGRGARGRPAALRAADRRRIDCAHAPWRRPIRIVIVEDNKVFREALELLLGLRNDIVVVASVADGEAAVPACREHEPQVALMDYRLPGLDGVEATRALKEACPRVAVVASPRPRTGRRCRHCARPARSRA